MTDALIRPPEPEPAAAEGELLVETSFAQQSLWFLDQLEPGTPTYNVAAAVRVRGALDAGALERALGEVVRRHESLRTVFEAGPEVPMQVIAPGARPVVPVTEVTEDQVPGLIEAEADTPFDLARGPLLRMRLLRLAADHHVAVVVMHHIVTDGWSSGVLFQELAACLEAYAAGREPRLPPPALQYADYAVWQRETLEGTALEEAADYWRERLAGVAPLALPTDRPRPARPSSAGAVYFFDLPDGLMDRVGALAARHQATPFMVLLAAYQVLLARICGGDDIAVATPVAGRGRPELAGLIGLFVNTVVIRTRVAGGACFAEVLDQVREHCLGAYAHQDAPFEKVVELLRPPRTNTLGSPLAQTMFSFQNIPQEPWSAGDLVFEPLTIAARRAKYELLLEIEPWAGGHRGAFEYSTELFDAERVTALAGHFTTLLGAALDAPERPVARLPLLTPAERSRLVDGWNTPRPPGRVPGSLHALIAARAARCPDATAVVCGERRLSHGELDRAAGLAARRLRAAGVGPETPVALLLERSADLVVWLLAVLKAGGCCVPLDPAQPAERIAFLLDDSGTRHVVADGAPPLDAPGVTVVRADEPSPPDGPPLAVADVDPDRLAYLVYTSGSTGAPKGVMVTHGGAASLASAAADAFGLTAEDRYLQLAPLGFDVLAEEVFPVLAAGGSVALPEGEAPLAARELWTLVERTGATALSTTPARLLSWGAADRAAVPASLRTVVFGSEAAPPPARLRPWHDWPGRLIHVYGLSETSCTNTAHVVAPDDTAAAQAPSVPIGRRLVNSELYVLDEVMEPVPDGVAGELYIGGPAVGRGYRGRPALTAERYVPDPFGPPGSRLYRTGDLVVRLRDGALRFLGRTDRQVKVRGFRVEPGEVEAVLLDHPGVGAAAVTARPDASGTTRLLAYAEPRPGTAPAGDELLALLRSRLPEHLVPARVVVLPRLPLTGNGKTDYAALPDPDPVRSADRTAPRTPVERELAAIVAGVLGVDEVGVHDDFFDLGGHSLAVLRLSGEVEARFGVELPMRLLFGAEPTVAVLAEHVFRELVRRRDGGGDDA
ncbi:non-ribosomal peptide synthetase [Streptantibioticus cattleyicolor]|uniref:Amino acid adenylation domain-containing protein n=1 Tax=Streptantibioticus cattleyicolor (strain ATCC 35852 / DSM 46488 / JCM 4925 / NBRC 14057 / NRRL 8057) TaxID=1003195 RepID=F8JMJ8_STREN|nr:non-ribosomal peptide synthetase [Streptantibioticus cattleyicolor]AEW99319.1 amino acid adenylation domain-containing protein [Streptantibioticus cattleyicolor NRRL 8057 = DSM 46488]CCB71642.1 protein of unknown function [Streptantibioticus cattleyicolor NRRL 8057 = DSM 46488]